MKELMRKGFTNIESVNEMLRQPNDWVLTSGGMFRASDVVSIEPVAQISVHSLVTLKTGTSVTISHEEAEELADRLADDFEVIGQPESWDWEFLVDDEELEAKEGICFDGCNKATKSVIAQLDQAFLLAIQSNYPAKEREEVRKRFLEVAETMVEGDSFSVEEILKEVADEFSS